MAGPVDDQILSLAVMRGIHPVAMLLTIQAVRTETTKDDLGFGDLIAWEVGLETRSVSHNASYVDNRPALMADEMMMLAISYFVERTTRTGISNLH